MPLNFHFDFLNPDYSIAFSHRLKVLQELRRNPHQIPYLKAYYKEHPAQFIIDWGTTQDPRNPSQGLPANMPFLLFPKQEEFVEWFTANIVEKRGGVAAKCRDVGFSWLTVATFCTLALFRDDYQFAYTSYKDKYVDQLDDPDAFFYRLRLFRSLLPPEFNGNYDPKHDTKKNYMQFRETGSTITGEVGQDVGRGGRKTCHVVDESAKIRNPVALAAALLNATDCCMHISTARGRANAFARMYLEDNSLSKFRFDWYDDPRKDQAWFERKEAEARAVDYTIFRQEVLIDFDATTSGKLIESEWLDACVDAHIKLGIVPTGTIRGALDVADEGKDKNAFIAGKGCFVAFASVWSGKGSDIFETTERTLEICSTYGIPAFKYDADGLGAGVRGDARVLNKGRQKGDRVRAEAFKGSWSGKRLYKPDGPIYPGSDVKNVDHYANYKAQCWYMLRRVIIETYRAVTIPGYKYDENNLLFIPSNLPHLAQLKSEIAQVTYSESGTSGKLIIDKAPEGAPSPNLADSLMMFVAPSRLKNLQTT